LNDSLTRLSLGDGPGLALAAAPDNRDWNAFSVVGTLPPAMFTCLVNMGLLPTDEGFGTAALGKTFGMACRVVE